MASFFRVALDFGLWFVCGHHRLSTSDVALDMNLRRRGGRDSHAASHLAAAGGKSGPELVMRIGIYQRVSTIPSDEWVGNEGGIKSVRHAPRACAVGLAQLASISLQLL